VVQISSSRSQVIPGISFWSFRDGYATIITGHVILVVMLSRPVLKDDAILGSFSEDGGGLSLLFEEADSFFSCENEGAKKAPGGTLVHQDPLRAPPSNSCICAMNSNETVYAAGSGAAGLQKMIDACLEVTNPACGGDKGDGETDPALALARSNAQSFFANWFRTARTDDNSPTVPAALDAWFTPQGVQVRFLVCFSVRLAPWHAFQFSPAL
jgi:hypothetical protein